MTTSIVSVDSATSKLQVGGVDALTFNSSGGLSSVASINGSQLAGMRNLIINGDMRVDQRNSGSAVSMNNSGSYVVDRWSCTSQGGAGTGIISFQGVSDAPTGFISSLKATVTNAKTAVGSDAAYMYQPVEALNCAALGYGGSNPKTAALSFWVKCSVTGTHSGFLRSILSGAYRSYVFTYTVNAANTWEYKTVIVPGDTVAMNTDNTTGIGVLFDLGSGASNETSTINAWQTGNYYRTSGSVRLLSVLNATFQVTGVQLEVSSAATLFENRPYGLELLLCQRYFEAGYAMARGYGASSGAGYCVVLVSYKANKRAAPTVALSAVSTNGVGAPYVNVNGVDCMVLVGLWNSTTSDANFTLNYTSSSEL